MSTSSGQAGDCEDNGFGFGLVKDPIAVVSMACRLPGADDLDEFWEMLVSGRSAVQELPENVINRERFYDPSGTKRATSYSDVGAITSRKPISAKALGLKETELGQWDDCHLQFASVAKEAWEQRFVKTEACKQDRCGVFVGHSGGYNSSELVYATMSPVTAGILEDCESFRQLPATLQSQLQSYFQQNMIAGRPRRAQGQELQWDVQDIAKLVAKITATSGPQIVVESACASSSVALCLAALALNSNDIDTAIVGGASYNKFDSLILFSQAQSCSSTDSRPFDDAADGLISSEGFVVIVLKRLDDAIRDGDTIHGVIAGAGMASDGRGKSLWAPRPEGQIESMRRAYRDREHLAQVQYIEAHATSTQVGDATETAALSEFYRKALPNKRFPLGSVKSNIGHTLESAGLSGLLKTLLAMKFGTIPPSINFQTPNKQIDWSSTPFDVVSKPVEWKLSPTQKTRVAAVNSFGIGGLNVHLVVEQFNIAVHQRIANKPKLVNSREPIAVVGLGVVLPGANNSEELSRLIGSDKQLVQSPPTHRWPESLPSCLGNGYRVQGGYIDNFQFDWRSNRIPPKQVQNANPVQFMLLHAAGDALKQSGLLDEQGALQHIGVIVGTIFGGEFSHGLCIDLRLQNLLAELSDAASRARVPASVVRNMLIEFEDCLLKRQPALLDETGSFTSSTLASRITKHFNLMGGAFAMDAGVTSSEQALEVSMRLLRNGSVNALVCATGSQELDYYAFTRMHAEGLLPGQASNLDATAPGEGVVALVLERLSDAKAKNHRILGVIEDVQAGSRRKEAGRSVADQQKIKLEHQIGRIAGSEMMVALAANLVDEKKLNCGMQTLTKTYPDDGTSRLQFSVGTVPEVRADFAAKNNYTSHNSVMPLSYKNEDRTLEIIGCLPGQGSSHHEVPNHPLLQNDAAKLVIHRANAALQSLSSLPFDALCKFTSANPLENVWPIQASTLIADVAVAEAVMSAKGIRFDAFIGHSLGELAALVVVKAWSLETAIQFVHARAAAVRNAVKNHRTGMMSISADSQRVESLLKGYVNTLSLTHRNAPEQSVVGGSVQELQRFKEVCKSNRISAIELNVPAAYHSATMAWARNELLEHVRNLRLLPAKTPVLSTVTGRFVSEPEEIRQNMIDQLVTPVDYVRDIRRLVELGAKQFVELGAGNVLSKLNRAISLDTQSLTAEQLFSDANAHSNGAPAHTNYTNASVSNGTVSEHPSVNGLNGSHKSARRLIDATSSRRSEMRNKSEKQAADAASQRQIKTHEVAKPKFDVAAVTISAPQTFDSVLVSGIERGLAIDRLELQKFIIDFIVEHTGYPLEMIDPKWDLEADLGVDSIKQAQLFGELRQTFDLDPSRFRSVVVRTIDDICDAIAGDTVSAAPAITYVGPATESPSIVEHYAVAETLPSSHSNGSNGTSQVPVPFAIPDTKVTAFMVDRIPVVRLEERSLNDFMVDFVVEHTGYPREMVDLDAEFEADLGLDSIKLAQLIGEIRSSFDIELTQDDRKAFIQCRTLRDISSYLLTRPSSDSNANSIGHEGVKYLSVAPAFEPAIPPAIAIAPAVETSLPIKKKRPTSRSESRIGGLGKLDRNGESDSTRDRVRLKLAEPEESGETRKVDRLPVAELRLAVAKANSFETERRFRQDFLDKQSTEPTVSAEAPTEPTVTGRYEMTMQSKPLEEPASIPRFFGRALVVGENQVADELVRRLNELGVECVRLSNAESKSWVQQLEQHWNEGILPHLFLTSPHDAQAKAQLKNSWWSRRWPLAVDDLFWLCQRWYTLVRDANLLQDCSLVATPNLGGDFGFASKVEAFEGGAVAGLVKALIIECWMAGERRLNFKLVDLAKTLASTKCVDAILTELSYGSYDTEVGYTDQGRAVVRAMPKRSVTSKAARRPKSGDVWIVSGGARGITAFVCEALAKRYQLRLNLIGMTALMNIPDSWRSLDEAGMRALKLEVMNDARNNPHKFNNRNPLKVWQSVEKTLEIEATLKKMREQGIAVEYHACDCADAASLRQIVVKIQEEQGEIRGILHGAGVGQDSRFDRKQRVKVNECFAAKIGGAVSLLDVVDTDALQFFIAFGSISGRFGANGHTDYSGANEGLVKVCDFLRSSLPHVRTIGFHWHAWGDVGMATKPETKLALESIGMQFMPATEGLNHLINEIEHANNATEVLITDDRYHRAFYPAETVENENGSSKRTQIHALVDSASLHVQLVDQQVRSNVSAVLHPAKDPFLVEHRINNFPLLPVVVDAELLVEAALEHCLHLPVVEDHNAFATTARKVSLKNFEVHAPLKFFCDQDQNVTINTVGNSPNQSLAVELSAKPLNRSGIAAVKDRVLCNAMVSFASTPIQVKPVPSISTDKLPWFRPQYTQPTDDFFSGAPFRLIQRIAISEQVILADLTSPSLVELAGLNRDATGWKTPSAILDAALYTCGILAWQAVKPGVCLPTGFESLEFCDLPRPGKRLRVVARLSGYDDKSVSFDFDVIDAEGVCYIAATGYRASFVHQ